MRADAFLITESDFFQTILERHEAAQHHLNALPARLSTAVPAADQKPLDDRGELLWKELSRSTEPPMSLTAFCLTTVILS